MNILSGNTVAAGAKPGTVIGKFSRAGSGGVQFVLDTDAALFRVDSSGQLVWNPPAGGAHPNPGFYSVNVLAISSGYVQETSNFQIQVTP